MKPSPPRGGYQPGAGQAAIPRSPGFCTDGYNPYVTSTTAALLSGSYLHVPPANSPSASSWSPGHRSGPYFSTPPKRDSKRPGPHNVTPSRADSRQAVSIDALQVDNSGQSLGSSPTTQQVDNACQSMDVSATIQMELVDNTNQPQVALPPMQAQPVDNASQPRTDFPLIQTQAVDSTDQGQAVLPSIEAQQMGNTGQPWAAFRSMQTQQLDNAGQFMTASPPMPQVEDTAETLGATLTLPRVDLSGHLVTSSATTRQAKSSTQPQDATIAMR